MYTNLEISVYISPVGSRRVVVNHTFIVHMLLYTYSVQFPAYYRPIYAEICVISA